MTNSGYTFILASWRNDAEDIRSVREPVLREVFGTEWDFGDPADEDRAYHVVTYDAAGYAVGAARMQPDGRIDYIAVHKPWRGATVGGAMLVYLLHIASKQRLDHVWVHDPVPAQKFFSRNRFVAVPNGPDAGRRWVRRVEAPGDASGVPH